MGFNFPNSPLEGQVYQPVGGPAYIWRNPVWETIGVGSIVDVTDLAPGVRTFDTRAQAALSTIEGAIQHISVLGRDEIDDGFAATYTRIPNVLDDYDFTDAGGTQWYRTKVGTFRSWARPSTSNWQGGRSFRSAVLIGESNCPAVDEDSTNFRGNISIGHTTLVAADGDVFSIVAIGNGVMALDSPGNYNIGIGNDALTNLDGGVYAERDSKGHRNIAIGSLAGHFLTTGNQNTLIGRDSGHSLIAGYGNVGVGYRACAAGYNPLGLSSTIENHYASNAIGNTAVGVAALHQAVGAYNVAVGHSAGYQHKGGGSVIIGSDAGYNLDQDMSENGKVIAFPGIVGTFTQTGTTITITATASGVVAGNKVGLVFGAGSLASFSDLQWLNVASVVNANTFTVVSGTSMSGSGSVTVAQVETATTREFANFNVIIGEGTAMQARKLEANVLIGWDAAPNGEGDANTMVGQRAGWNLVVGTLNTGVGYNALRNTLTGSNFDYSNCASLGAWTQASGSNQVQLGDSATTTYAYGAVQARSDARDKADVQDTQLGLDFILALRPVDYRWDYREDYVTVVEDIEDIPVKRQVGVPFTDANGEPRIRYEEQAVTRQRKGSRTVVAPKDGSKTRTRFHHGFIAQEILEITDQFGGVQDHSINGGEDVMSLGYDELIAPLVKAVQQLTARVAELETQLAGGTS